ncbi:MAG: FAD-dependent monooxygenase [Pseudomonadota bacterium]
MINGQTVAVIGAGVAGLAAATALAQRGAQVTVYEQAAGLAPVGAGLQISPNGARVLAELGIELAAVESQAVELRNFADGRRVLRLDLTGDRYGLPFKLAHRADLIDALARAARATGVTLAFGEAVEADQLEADVIVGADGVKSRMRPALNGDAEPFFTGQVAWRAVVEDAAAPEAHVYMGPGRHLVTYPLIGGRRNIVAVEERIDWVDEDWDLADDPASLRQAFLEFAPEVGAMLEKVEAVKLWGLFRHPVAARWQDGRQVLIGDAAHPTLPFLAQGANLALEDAYVLARHLETKPSADALATFEAARKPRVTRAIRAANGNARNYHITDPWARWVAHTGLRAVDRLAPGMMLARFDWLYGFDPTA